MVPAQGFHGTGLLPPFTYPDLPTSCLLFPLPGTLSPHSHLKGSSSSFVVAPPTAASFTRALCSPYRPNVASSCSKGALQPASPCSCWGQAERLVWLHVRAVCARVCGTACSCVCAVCVHMCAVCACVCVHVSAACVHTCDLCVCVCCVRADMWCVCECCVRAYMWFVCL